MLKPKRFLIGLLAVALLFVSLSGPAETKEGEELPISITVQSKWTNCSGKCDGRKSANRYNSGNMNVTITGTVAIKGESKEFLRYEPSSLKAVYAFENEEKAVDSECAKCNPVEKYKGNGTIDLKADGMNMAFLQAFFGKTGAVMAMQLDGTISPEAMLNIAQTKEQKIYNFSAIGPMEVRYEKVDSCKSCRNAAPETRQISFGLALLVDMVKHRTGFKKWKTSSDILHNPGFAVTMAAGKELLGPEKGNGTAECSVRWSIGDVAASGLKLKRIYFNFDQNKDSAVQLKKHTNDQDIVAPEWTSDGTNNPAAFIRDSKFKVKAVFEVKGRIEKAEIWTEEESLKDPNAAVQGGFSGLKKTVVTFSEGETEKEVELTINAPQQVISLNKLRWRWLANVWYRGSAEPQEDMVIMTAGAEEKEYTDHTIYIVGGKPQTKNTYEVVVKKGCLWAEGSRGGDDAFKLLWNNFLNISCPEENPCTGNPMPGIMAYAHAGVPEKLLGLLQQGKGTCGAWQEFFTSVTGCQGIKVIEHTICPKKTMNLETGNFDQEIISMIARPGDAQGNKEPSRIFFNHAINEYNNVLYDPSYYVTMQVGPVEPASIYENEVFTAYCAEGAEKDFSMCTHLESNKAKFQDCLEKKSTACRRNDPLFCEVFLTPGKCP